MKKYHLTALGLAALAMLPASCQLEERGANVTGEVDFRIEAGIPAGLTTYAGTAAFSHQGGARNLDPGQYDLRYILEVYDGNALAYREVKYEKEDFSRKVSFSARLLAKNYDAVLWADFVEEGAEELYYRAESLKEIRYTAPAGENGFLATDAADAYCASFEMDLTAAGLSKTDVVLKRPFGKMRFIATDELTDPESQDERPSIVTLDFKGSSVPSSFNALTGEAGEPDRTVGTIIFGAAREDASVNGGAPQTGAYLLGYAYFFSQKQSAAYPVEVTVTSDKAARIGYRELSNIPVQANRLTTVIGNFYSNEGSLEVVVEDGFDEESPYSVWSGSADRPVIDKQLQTVQVFSADQLAGFAELINSGNTFEGYTVTLHTDVDLDGKPWTPIGNGRRNSSAPDGDRFQGTFDGNGKTIANLNIVNSEITADEAVGFFGVVDGGSVKDLTFTGVNIQVPANEMAGAAVGMLTGGGSVSGIDVYGAVSAIRGNGGIVGRLVQSGTISECRNYAEVSGTGYNIGGIVGAAYYTAVDSEMHIENCTNFGAVKGTAGAVGGIAGLSAAIVQNCTNEADVTGSGASIGGIVAEQQNAGSVIGCVNRGNIVNGSDDYGTGGIIGWIRYTGAESAYPRKNIIEVRGNINHGTVQGGNDAGGIVGTVYSYGQVSENQNYAPALRARTFAAGIVGNAQFTEGHPGMVEEEMLYVTNNSSTTSLSAIAVEGSCKDLFVYINNQDKVVVEGNSGPAFPDNGAGTAESPKLINTAEDLKALAGMVNSGTTFEGVHIRLNADVDLSGYTPWTPIGTREHKFMGVFDGNGRTVSNLKVAQEADYAGLFGIIATPAEIRNLTIFNADVSGLRCVGALAGSAYTGAVSGCRITGDIRIAGNYKVGGLAGEGYARITDCSVEGNAGSTVTATFAGKDYEGDNVGGLIGYTGEGKKGHARWSVSSVTVTGTRKVGGTIGYLNYGVEIEGVTVNGVTVRSNADESYVRDNAGKMFVGGIVGEFSVARPENLPSISGSIASSSVSGPSAGVRVGGGRNQTFESRQAVLENLTKDEASVAVAQWYGEHSAANILADESGKRVIVTDPAGLAALSDYLSAFQSEVDYYQWGWNIVLDEDISVFDLSGKEWTPIKVFDFKGFDGGNIVVRNFVVNAAPGEQAGFFSSFTHNSSDEIDPIRNLVIENAVINGPSTGGTAGVVVGGTDFTLQNCTVRNSAVKGGSYTGGLVGYSYGDFIDCGISETTVTGIRKDAGGLVGFLNESRTVTGNQVGAGTVIRMADGSEAQNVGWLVGRWNYPNGGAYDKPSTVDGNTKDVSVSVENEVGMYVNERP